MNSVHITEAAKVHHAALVHRLAVVQSAGVSAERFVIADHSENIVQHSRGLRLRRGDRCRLVGEQGGHGFELRYHDGAADGALAAAVAAATRPGMPVALDPQSLAVLALADRLANSEIPVLITGPTGTGKEVLSRFIHERSTRASGPFIAINCAAMPETMLEAMLFGHVKGAFTGASAAGEGFFRAAHGGTLLLDEIAELPLGLQSKLLRALQEGEVVPIGATRPIKVDVRIVAAVLGVVKTMGSIDQPPAVLGGMIGSALVGTFLGVLLAYGIVGPLATRLKQVIGQDEQVFHAVKQVVISSLHGWPQPLVVESARSGLGHAFRPGLTELLDSLRGR